MNAPVAPFSITRLGPLVTALGECPVWHRDRLWLIDARSGALLALAPDSGEVRCRLQAPPPLGSFSFDVSGAIVLALKDQIAALDPHSGRLRTLARLPLSHPDLRLNDGIALADGSLVVGSMHVPCAEGETPLGGWYRLGPDLRLHLLAPDVGIANGPCEHPLSGRLYLADSARRTVVSGRIGTDGRLADVRPFVSTASHGSGPDGCCFDTEGGLWTALVRSGALARFDDSGRLTHHIPLPLAHPSAVCFGGAAMDELFVTSIRDSGRLRADGPLDGAVLRLRGLGFRGRPRPLCRLAL